MIGQGAAPRSRSKFLPWTTLGWACERNRTARVIGLRTAVLPSRFTIRISATCLFVITSPLGSTMKPVPAMTIERGSFGSVNRPILTTADLILCKTSGNAISRGFSWYFYSTGQCSLLRHGQRGSSGRRRLECNSTHDRVCGLPGCQRKPRGVHRELGIHPCLANYRPPCPSGRNAPETDYCPGPAKKTG